MKKKFLSSVSATLAVCMAFSVALPLSASAGSYSASIAETRYRYYTSSFDGAAFKKGAKIDGLKGIRTDNPNDNRADGTFHAIIDSYPTIGGSSNKALKIVLPNKETIKPNGIYTSIVTNPNKTHGTSKVILSPDQAFSLDANDHGYVFHVEVKALTGANQEDGFCYIDSNDPTKITKHYAKDMNVSIQERDYPNGKPVADPKDDSKPLTTAMNMGENNKITFVWSKDVKFEYEEPRLDNNGKEMKDEKDEVIYDKKNANHKKGDVEYMMSKGGGVAFPRDFCGYVIIPMSSFLKGIWNGGDTDGKLNLMYFELVNFVTGLYQQYKGEIWIDDCAFYGPTFAKVSGAFDVTIDPKNPAARTQKAITAEKPSEPAPDPYGDPDQILNKTTSTNGATVSTDVSADASQDAVSADESLIIVDGVSDDQGETVSNQKDLNDNPNLWWIWIVVGVVVLAGAGVGVWFYLRKRNGDEFDEDDFSNQETTINDENQTDENQTDDNQSNDDDIN